jgi:hypothetical protein
MQTCNGVSVQKVSAQQDQTAKAKLHLSLVRRRVCAAERQRASCSEGAVGSVLAQHPHTAHRLEEDGIAKLRNVRHHEQPQQARLVVAERREASCHGGVMRSSSSDQLRLVRAGYLLVLSPVRASPHLL